jgi:hypothetical protein
MAEGQINTFFNSDPQKMLADLEKIRAKQRDMEGGWNDWSKAAKKAGFDISAALGFVDQEAVKLDAKMKDVWLGIETGAGKAVSSIKGGFQDLDKLMGVFDSSTRDAAKTAEVLEGKYKDCFLGIETGARRAIDTIRQGFVSIDAQLGMRPGYDWNSSIDAATARMQGNVNRDNRESKYRGVMDRDVVGAIEAQGGLPKEMVDEILAFHDKKNKAQKEHNTELTKTKDLMGGWARGALTVATSYFGIQEAINMAMNAHKAMEDMQEKARQAQMTAAEAHERMFTNVGSDEKAFNQLLGDSDAIAKEFGISDQNAMARLMETASSKAAGDPTKAAEIARATAEAKPFSIATEGQAYATGVANLMNSIPGLSARQASSMLLTLGEKSSIVSQAMLSEHLTPAGMAGLATSDLTKISATDVVKESIAGSATLAKFGGDEEGRKAATNWNLFSAATQKFVKDNKLEDAGSAMRRVDAMSPEQLAEFEEKLGGDASMKPFVQMLAIQRDEKMQAYYRSTRDNIDTTDGRHQQHAKALKNLTPATRTAMRANKGKALNTLNQLDREDEASLATMREHLSSARESQLALGGADEYVYQNLENLMLTSGDYGSTNLQSAEARVQAVRNQIGMNKKFYGPGGEYENQRPDNYDKEMKKQEDTLAAMEEIVKAMRENSEATNRNTEASGGTMGSDKAKRKNRG